MTETSTTPDTLAPTADAATAAPKKSGGGLGGKVLAELQEIAGGLGIDGAPQMRKGALIDAIVDNMRRHQDGSRRERPGHS